MLEQRFRGLKLLRKNRTEQQDVFSNSLVSIKIPQPNNLKITQTTFSRTNSAVQTNQINYKYGSNILQVFGLPKCSPDKCLVGGYASTKSKFWLVSMHLHSIKRAQNTPLTSYITDTQAGRYLDRARRGLRGWRWDEASYENTEGKI